MFWKKTTTAPTQEQFNSIIDALNEKELLIKSNYEQHSSEKKQLIHDHQLEISKLQNSHELALKEKEFELKHHKDAEIKEAQDKATELQQANAVLENENKMLREITNLNADIIDIKDLVASLIKKLPEINLTSLTVQSSDKK